jgi:hypothetical protein
MGISSMTLGHDISSPFESQFILELGCRNRLLVSPKAVKVVVVTIIIIDD